MGIWIRDDLSVSRQPIVDGKLHEFTIADADSNHTIKPGLTLMAKLAASHWGYVNGNYFWYDPSTIDATLPTWTKPRRKPVLTSHGGLFSSDPETIGRIFDAKYTKGIAAEFVEHDVIPNNRPDGYLEFATRINDPLSQQKIIDGRYDTMSISAVATNVICSICGSKVDMRGDDEGCKHTRAKRYDKDGEKDEKGTVCYYKAGPLLGRHVAFVDSPADQYSGVLGSEYAKDSEDAVDSILSISERAVYELFIIDSAKKILFSLHDEEGNKYDLLNDVGKKTIIDMLNTKIDYSNSDGENTESEVDTTDVVDTNSDSDTNQGGDKMDKIDLIDSMSMTDEELEKAMDNLTEDAKLSYQSRKNLPDSAFCGPNRSFPAHDAAHVRNGLARLNQSNLSPSQKAKTLACLRSRAKKYGIKVSTKVKDEGNVQVIESIVVIDVLLSDATIDDILALDSMAEYLKSIGIDVENTDACDMTTSGEDTTGNATDTAGDTTDNTDNTDDTTGNSTDTTDDNTDTGTDNGDSEDDSSVSELESKVKALTDEVSAVTAQNVELMNRIKTTNANRVVDMMISLGEATEDIRDTTVAELIVKSDDDILDRITALEARVANGITSENADATSIDGDRDTNRFKKPKKSKSGSGVAGKLARLKKATMINNNEEG